MTVISKPEYIEPIFEIGGGIVLSSHLIHGLVFNDSDGYMVNKWLILEGGI